MNKTFTIHAGTFKTASTYIQHRLWKNEKILESFGIKLLYPKDINTGWFKEFAKWVNEKNYVEIKHVLSHIDRQTKHVIVSAEQFSRALLNEENVNNLQEVLSEYGYKLNIIIFLRDQPDYINSTYIQEVRRFYHSLNIRDFTRKCLNKKELKYNYEKMFSHLVDNKNFDATFLPYGSTFGDPFIRLIGSLKEKLPDHIDWISANPNNLNDQPGIKGVWLALKACKKMQKMGVNLKLIEDESIYIRKYSIPREWSKNRFYGLKPKKVKKIRDYYKSSNDRFARKAWGRETWAEIYENLPQQKYSILNDSLLSDEDTLEMKNLLSRVIADVKERNPHAFPDPN